MFSPLSDSERKTTKTKRSQPEDDADDDDTLTQQTFNCESSDFTGTESELLRDANGTVKGGSSSSPDAMEGEHEEPDDDDYADDAVAGTFWGRKAELEAVHQQKMKNFWRPHKSSNLAKLLEPRTACETCDVANRKRKSRLQYQSNNDFFYH